jgi:ribonucleoside-diphosphate reductase alpha chain
VQLDLTESAMEDDIDAQRRAAEFADSPDDEYEPSHGGGPGAQKVTISSGARVTGNGATARQVDAMQSALSEMMGDAPLCDTCGHITVRNGSCYRCLNCGNSMGCS